VQLAVGEPHGRQRGEHSQAARAAGLGETDRHPRHVDVPNLLQPGDHVVAQPAHVEGEVEAGGRCPIAAEQSLWAGGIHP
jgi:hypothetical protein